MTPATRTRLLRVGLTGGIGSGKSTVARRLAERGAALIDADALARAVSDERAVVDEVRRALGDELVREGRLDRAAVARRVFGDEAALRTLERIVHPRVRAAAKAREAELERDARVRVVVHDVPLLFERGLDHDMDVTVAVVAPLDVRVERAVARGGTTADDVRARDASQLPLAEKAERATYVLDNSGTLEDLHAQVDALWEALAERAEGAELGDGERAGGAPR